VVQKHADPVHLSRLLRLAGEWRKEQNKCGDDRSELHGHLGVDTAKSCHNVG
jgi:hypothetical protein